MTKPASFVRHSGKLNLGDLLRLLVNEGIVEKSQAEMLYKDRKLDSSKMHPLVVIGEQKWETLHHPHTRLSTEYLSRWLADIAKLEYFVIDPLKMDYSSIGQVVSKAYAERLRIMPVRATSNEVVFATCDPFATEWIPDLEKILKKSIKLVVSNPVDINRYLPEFFDLANSINLANVAKSGQVIGVQNLEQLVELGKTTNLDANEQHVVNIVDWLFKYAFEQRASDIHLEPRRNLGILRFRIDGVLHQVYQLPSAIMNAITSRIKLLGRMDMVEKRRPQDGRLKTVTADGQEIELRLSTMPTAFGEKLVMRIFSPENLVKNFIQLGFSPDQSSLWENWTANPNGIILVTGPTGSGKTTTLYTTLKQLATESVNVCTVEDPIEMIEPSFNQMQVQENIDLYFADGIRTLMRQDPDIIMVGEIRDGETAEMATQAALTGHLVLSTLHTNDAPSSVTRLLDLKVPAYLINSTILGIMAQRLVRTLCANCKIPVDIDEDTWKQYVSPWKLKKPKHIYQAVGCVECRNTGFRGRTGIYEMLTMSQSIKKLVAQNADLNAIKQQAYKEGMKPLLINGAEKIAEGFTTFEELLKVAPPPFD